MSSKNLKCCVPGCTDAVCFHRFPNPLKEPERFTAWVAAIGGPILKLSDIHIQTYRRVCSAHFEQRFFCRNKRLSKAAIPSLNLTGPVPEICYNQAHNIPTTSLVATENVPSTITSTQGVISMEIEHIKENQLEMQNFLYSSSVGSPLPPNKTYARKTLEPIANIFLDALSSPSVETPLLQKSTCSEKPSKPIENIMADAPSTSEGSVPKHFSASSSACPDEVLETQPSKCQDSKKSKKTIKFKPKTFTEKAIYDHLLKIRAKLNRLKSTHIKRTASLRAAKNLMNNSSFIEVLKHLPTAAKTLILLQFREYKKKEKGRRFSTKEKLLALSIFKKSPKAYRFMRKIFILPAPQTLIKLINMANIEAGINETIFKQLKEKSKTMKNEEKLCVLLFDEMAIKPNLFYNERKDNITGFVTDGETKANKLADHAQVFMIRGLVKNYKLPVGYTFSAAATKGPELAKQIKQFVRAINNAGFEVVATVCDQGAGNRSAIKHLIEESRATWLRNKEEPKKNIILIDDKELIPLYDPPHLIKCIRNNLITKNIEYKNDKNEINTAKWEHIQKLYEENPGYQGLRLIPKLTESHVIPSKIPKMKVKYATQLFSQTVAANMGYLSDKKILPEECKATADLILFFDELFDSTNGSYTKKHRFAKPALGPVTPYSVHDKIWSESIRFLKSMSFINKLNAKKENVPTLPNWVWTLEGIKILLKKLEREHGVTSVWMRHLNQDPLENFFGSIRSHGCRNTNPTPAQFQSAFASLLINNLSSVHAPGRNCEDDSASSLYSLVIDLESKPNKENFADHDLGDVNINIKSLEEKNSCPKIKGIIEYCSGYFAYTLKKKIFKRCKSCCDIFLNPIQSSYIKYREFSKKQWLCSPTDIFLKHMSEIHDLIYEIVRKKASNNLLKMYLKTVILMFIDFDFITCAQHKDLVISFLINAVSRFFIYTYCKNINKIIEGRRNVEDGQDTVQILARRHYEKSLKKK